ncbi:hypothetical protein ACFQ9X_31115 [Catenulispora yoronensis]
MGFLGAAARGEAALAGAGLAAGAFFGTGLAAPAAPDVRAGGAAAPALATVFFGAGAADRFGGGGVRVLPAAATAAVRAGLPVFFGGAVFFAAETGVGTGGGLEAEAAAGVTCPRRSNSAYCRFGERGGAGRFRSIASRAGAGRGVRGGGGTGPAGPRGPASFGWAAGLGARRPG